MANRPQTEKLAKLGLLMHECGRLFSARKPGAYGSKCGPDIAPIDATKPKRSRAKKAVDRDESAPPVSTEAQRQKNQRAREARAARRAGLGSALLPTL